MSPASKKRDDDDDNDDYKKERSLVDPLQLMVSTTTEDKYFILGYCYFVQVKNELTFLLRHPVVSSYIYLKWKKVGAKFYAINLMAYVFFIFFLSLYAMTVNHPLSESCKLIKLAF